MQEPKRWSSAWLKKLCDESIMLFRTGRVSEPRIYSEFFEEFVPVFRKLIETSLPRLVAGRANHLITEIVSDENARTAFRYLAAPPISDDDLKTLAATKLTPTALRTNVAEAERVRRAVLNVIDPHRFPWIREKRRPSSWEKKTAIVASAVLVAIQKVGTKRRSSAKSTQEMAIKQLLNSLDFEEVLPRTIPLLEDGPRPGQYCGESKLGDTRADLVIRLPDRRYMAIECKVSNSAVNSFKRVNHEALGKARRWVQQFGQRAVVPAAVLAGVFNPQNLKSAQDDGLYLIWGHRPADLSQFIKSCRSR